MTRENRALFSELKVRQLDDECADDDYDEYDDAYDITDDSDNFMILLMSCIHYMYLLYSLYLAVVFTIYIGQGERSAG